MIIIKFASTQTLLHGSWIEHVISSLSHFTYNTASIGALQTVSSLTHAILNLSKRVFVIFTNIAYFQTPLSACMVVGLLVFFVGLFFYFKIVAGSDNSKTSLSKRTLLLIALIAACLYWTCVKYGNIEHDLPNKCANVSESILVQKIVTAWMFGQPTPLSVTDNIKSLSQQNSNVPIHVYCGTTQCVNASAELEKMTTTAEVLVIPDIVEHTPLEHWTARHLLNKVFSRKEFEIHLQIAAQLGILWHQGGIYVDSTLKITRDSLSETRSTKSAWIGKGMSGCDNNDVSYFPKEHQFIAELAKMFVNEYSRGALQFSFSKS